MPPNEPTRATSDPHKPNGPTANSPTQLDPPGDSSQPTEKKPDFSTPEKTLAVIGGAVTGAGAVGAVVASAGIISIPVLAGAIGVSAVISQITAKVIKRRKDRTKNDLEKNVVPQQEQTESDTSRATHEDHTEQQG